MRVIVCGGRDYRDTARVTQVLNEFGIEELAHGGAAGADARAHDYAIARGITIQQYTANWHEHGKAAGPKRNQFMLDDFKPDAVIAFPGGAGTADMVRRALAAGVNVIEVQDDSTHGVSL